MGEVIDQHQMIKRMKTKLYKNNNYMVQLKHDEIIDATRKGNITRFINHSCEPNCVAEKVYLLNYIILIPVNLNNFI
jgi:histone-lysine N-methyltransferase SETD2